MAAFFMEVIMLDFSKVKKHFMNITMQDGTVYLVFMPKKATYERYLAMQVEKMETAQKLQGAQSSGADAINAISTEDILKATNMTETYEVAAEILSNNKQGKTVTAAELSESLDMEDITLFFREFAAFVNSTSQNPN